MFPIKLLYGSMLSKITLGVLLGVLLVLICKVKLVGAILTKI